jgi:hypothetical protein
VSCSRDRSSAFHWWQRRASVHSRRLCRGRLGEPCCKPSAPKSFSPCRTTSPRRSRANCAGRMKNGASTITSRRAARFESQLSHGQASRRQGAQQHFQDVQPPAGLPVRHQDVYGTEERDDSGRPPPANGRARFNTDLFTPVATPSSSKTLDRSALCRFSQLLFGSPIWLRESTLSLPKRQRNEFSLHREYTNRGIGPRPQRTRCAMSAVKGPTSPSMLARSSAAR